MSKYVDADKLFTALNRCCDLLEDHGETETAQYKGVRFALELSYELMGEMIEVVRCKDCRFSPVTELRELYCCRLEDIVGAEDYCSKGERREDGTT